MRVVLDTNVVASASISLGGPPARVFFAWLRDTFELVVSEFLLLEYRRALLYHRVASRHGMNETEVNDIVEDIRQHALMVEPIETITLITDDPSDNKILECAVAGEADYIVSGDRHLLSIGEFRGIQILSPAMFLEVLQG